MERLADAVPGFRRGGRGLGGGLLRLGFLASVLQGDPVEGRRVDALALEQLEQDFDDQDPVLARVALFSLLHRGLALCPQLEHSPLNSSMTFTPA